MSFRTYSIAYETTFLSKKDKYQLQALYFLERRNLHYDYHKVYVQKPSTAPSAQVSTVLNEQYLQCGDLLRIRYARQATK